MISIKVQLEDNIAADLALALSLEHQDYLLWPIVSHPLSCNEVLFIRQQKGIQHLWSERDRMLML